MSNIVINAEIRNDLGKGSSRRLRRTEDKTPAVVYGAGKEVQSITLLHKDIIKATEDEAFFSSVITLDIAGNNEKVLLKDLQRHPAKAIVIHVDFLRVEDDKPITMSVPLHFINESSCYGVKMQGGRISHSLKSIEVTCLPKDLPSFIEVDLKDAKTGDILHISDIKLPEGVSAAALHLGSDHNLAIASILAVKGD